MKLNNRVFVCYLTEEGKVHLMIDDFYPKAESYLREVKKLSEKSGE